MTFLDFFTLLFLSITAAPSSSPGLPRSSRGLSVGRLKDAGRRHEVLDVLPEHLVLGAQAQVLLLNVVHTRREVVERVLELEHLRNQSGLFLLLLRREFVSVE